MKNNLNRLPKDILIKLLTTIQEDSNEIILELERKVSLAEKTGIVFLYCFYPGCRSLQVGNYNDGCSFFYRCPSCKEQFCDNHLVYRKTGEGNVCLQDISICKKYHKDINVSKNIKVWYP